MENNTDTDPRFDRNHNGEKVSGIMLEYIVEERDTLEDIARRYEISIHEIITANSEIASQTADLITPGLHLKIPRVKED